MNSTKDLLLTSEKDVLNELQLRASRMTKKAKPLSVEGKDLSVLFLRGVCSRAKLCLPAFYYFVGALDSGEYASDSQDAAFRVLQAYSMFSDLNTLTINCRKIFDHGAKDSLTGARFIKVSASDLEKHAKYWSQNSSKSEADALSALRFLTKFFKACSQEPSDLLQEPTRLQKRIGLLKQHADRSAAHLSLEPYALTLLDVAHVAAAIVIIGEIVKSFDDPTESESYFSNIDAYSRAAASRLFPQTTIQRLFLSTNIEASAEACWRGDHAAGMHWLMDELPRSIGWLG